MLTAAAVGAALGVALGYFITLETELEASTEFVVRLVTLTGGFIVGAWAGFSLQKDHG